MYVCVFVCVCACSYVHTCSGHCSLESLEVNGLYIIHTLGQTICQFDLLLLHIDSGSGHKMQHTALYNTLYSMHALYVCTAHTVRMHIHTFVPSIQVHTVLLSYAALFDGYVQYVCILCMYIKKSSKTKWCLERPIVRHYCFQKHEPWEFLYFEHMYVRMYVHVCVCFCVGT